MKDLIERVERAEGPCRELDVAIAVSIDWRWDDWEEGDPTVRGHVEKHGLGWMVERCRQSVTVWPRLLPAYTASIDAAMTLLPDGWRLRQMHFAAPCADCRKWTINLYGGREGENCFHAEAATPALALVAASLRALAMEGEE